MKRLFILAAATVALASCAKTQVVYNEEPQEIAFKTVENVMTKGVLDPGKDLGVFAEFYDGGVEGELYFGNSQFTYDTDSWTGNRYWPISNGLIFTVYSPYIDGNEKASWNTTTNTLTLKFDDNTSNNTDLLYGTTRPNGNKGSGEISIQLGHALALVTIKVSANASSIVTLESLAINKTVQSGTCSVDYGTTPPTVSWSSLGESVTSIILADSSTPLTVSPTNNTRLVVPTENISDMSLTLKYKLAGSDKEFTYTTEANALGTSWNHGKNYIYNITINPTQIEFDATEADWDANTDGNAGEDKTDIPIE